MKRHTTASCFATYLLPHVLFVADFEERERIVRVCCLAWNIGLFPDAAERAHHIENTLALFFDGEEAPPPPGVRQGYGEELHMLADLKRALFPWRFETVTEVGLKQAPRGDVLTVDNGKVVERIGLTPPPSIEGLPIITKALVQMHGDTQAQRRTLAVLRITIHVGAQYHAGDLRRIGAVGHPVQDAEIGLEVRPIVVGEVIGHGRFRKISHQACFPIARANQPSAGQIWS